MTGEVGLPRVKQLLLRLQFSARGTFAAGLHRFLALRQYCQLFAHLRSLL